MNEIKVFLMKEKPTLLDLAQPKDKMSSAAKTVFLASLERAGKEQNKLLKQARRLSR